MEGKGSQAMEKNHPVSELMAETIEKIKEAVDANTVVGEPIVAGEITSQRSPWDLALAARRWGGKPRRSWGRIPLAAAAALD